MRFLRIAIIVLLLTSSLGQLNRLFIGDQTNVVLYANDLATAVLAGLYLLYALISRKSWRIPPVMLGVWLFLAVGLLGLIISYTTLSKSELGISLFYLLRYVSYTVIFFVAFDSVLRTDGALDWSWLRRWEMVLLITSVLMAISGFVQLYFLPNLEVLAKYGWDPHVNRLVTSMLDPNFAGCYLSIGAGLAVSLYLFSHNGRQRAGLLVVIAVLTLAILLTYSRSGYLMLAIVLGVIALVKSRSLLVVGVVVAALAFISVPRIQERVEGALQGDTTASARVLSWENSWTIASHNLVAGVGFNAYRYAQDRYGILSLDTSGNAGAGGDSSWLFILATTGIIGLAVFGLTYLALGLTAIVAYQRSAYGPSRALALAFGAVVVGLGVASQFNNALFYTWILELFWLMAGLVVAISQLTRNLERPETT